MVSRSDFRSVVRSLAEAITIAEVGRLSVVRYRDVKWKSVNGLLETTNREWKIIPQSWYDLPEGEYRDLYPTWIGNFTGFIERHILRQQLSPLDFTTYWGLPSIPRSRRLEEYIRRYGAGELSKRKKLFIERAIANGVKDPGSEWITKYISA
jgi:hypothetical protein